MAKFYSTLALLAALALVCVDHAQAATSMAAALHVTVTGITSAGGTLRVELHDEATYSEAAAKPLRRQDIPKIAGDVSLTFPSLPPGAYALRAFQDANNNGKADPGEPSGISNGAGPGDFDAAALVLSPGDNQTVMHLK